jgi:large subunit ribosomal protein L25
MIMNETFSLQAQVREQTGSKAAAALRRQGRIPAIVYGHKEQPVAISLDAHDFVKGLHHGHRLVDVAIGSNTGKMLVKDLQYDHLGRNVIHADLMRVDVTEMIRVSVPLELKGTPKGAQEGGILEQNLDHLDVECLAINIPESVVVSVKDLDIGEAVHAGEVALPEGIELLTPAETVVASCHVLAVVKTTEELEAEVPVAPEVIRERAPTGEEEAAES